MSDNVIEERIQVSHREFVSCVLTDVLYRIEEQLPLLLYVLWGMFGAGKTRGAVPTLHKALEDATGFTWGLNTRFRACNIDAIDLRGLPKIIEDGALGMLLVKWAQAGFLPIAERDGEYGVLVIDELYLNPNVIGVLMELTGERQVGDYCLPPGWVILGLTNRAEDRSGVSRGNTMAQDNRAEHYELRLDVDEFIEDYAIPQQWDPRLIVFLNYKGMAALHEFPDGAPASVAKQRTAVSTPRSLERANYRLKQQATGKLSMNLLGKALAGNLGEHLSRDCMSFVRLFDNLPDSAPYWASPATEPFPAETDVQWALFGRLARETDDTNFDKFYVLCQRLPEEMMAPIMRQTVTEQPDLKITQTWCQFQADYAHLAYVR